MHEGAVTAQILVVILLIGCLLFLAVNRNFRFTISFSFADQQPKKSSSKTPLPLLWNGREQLVFSEFFDIDSYQQLPYF